jgi:ABC-type xylose transport system substrate-binding protein
MTIYKAIIPLANTAVEAALKLAKKEQLTGTQTFRNDKLGKDVPAILLEVQSVDRDNLMTTVIKDGYANYDSVLRQRSG